MEYLEHFFVNLNGGFFHSKFELEVSKYYNKCSFCQCEKKYKAGVKSTTGDTVRTIFRQ